VTEHIVLLVQPAMAPVARAAVRVLLDSECPRLGDVLVVVGEFVADAVRGPGSHFGVIVGQTPGQVRVEVEADAWSRDSDEYLLSIALVEGHADRWGRDHVKERGIWWAEFFWKEPEGTREQ
jgi:hypothetical protein